MDQPFSDEVMLGFLGKSRNYVVVTLQAGPAYEPPESRSETINAMIWEHGRRNFELRAAGKIALVGPALPGGAFLGLSIFTAEKEEVAALMDDDPAIAGGVFTYSLTSWRSFPGDSLPA